MDADYSVLLALQSSRCPQVSARASSDVQESEELDRARNMLELDRTGGPQPGEGGVQSGPANPSEQ
jgi:hypothetical protein